MSAWGGSFDSLIDDAMRWEKRALAAEAALERAVADADAQIVSVARDAEARGRQHGLLAAAWAVEESMVDSRANRDCVKHTVDRVYWDGVLDEDESLLGDLAKLATESA